MNKQNITINLSPLGIIKVAGPDAEKFLQGQLTCDVREITEQQSRLGAHCDHKGRMQATFRLFKYEADYYLQIPKNLIEHLLTTLKKYAIFSKVTLTDVSTEWQQLGISGPDSLAIINELFAQSAPTQIDTVSCTEQTIIIRIPSNDSPRFSLLAKNTTIENLTQRLQSHCQLADFSHWQLLDIEAGIPSLCPETTGLFTPHQINYPAVNGVSFNKGCYTGQEIVARMHYLGKLKQRMYKITFISSYVNISPGAPLVIISNGQSQECGTLVQACKTQQAQWLGLAVIYDTAIGQTLYIENLEQPILDIQDLPYTIQ